MSEDGLVIKEPGGEVVCAYERRPGLTFATLRSVIAEFVPKFHFAKKLPNGIVVPMGMEDRAVDVGLTSTFIIVKPEHAKPGDILPRSGDCSSSGSGVALQGVVSSTIHIHAAPEVSSKSPRGSLPVFNNSLPTVSRKDTLDRAGVQFLHGRRTPRVDPRLVSVGAKRSRIPERKSSKNLFRDDFDLEIEFLAVKNKVNVCDVMKEENLINATRKMAAMCFDRFVLEHLRAIPGPLSLLLPDERDVRAAALEKYKENGSGRTAAQLVFPWFAARCEVALRVTSSDAILNALLTPGTLPHMVQQMNVAQRSSIDEGEVHEIEQEVENLEDEVVEVVSSIDSEAFLEEEGLGSSERRDSEILDTLPSPAAQKRIRLDEAIGVQAEREVVVQGAQPSEPREPSELVAELAAEPAAVVRGGPKASLQTILPDVFCFGMKVWVKASASERRPDGVEAAGFWLASLWEFSPETQHAPAQVVVRDVATTSASDYKVPLRDIVPFEWAKRERAGFPEVRLLAAGQNVQAAYPTDGGEFSTVTYPAKVAQTCHNARSHVRLVFDDEEDSDGGQTVVPVPRNSVLFQAPQGQQV